MSDFFGKKKDWSRYKDFILSYYLEPYIPKVNKLNRPILVVDCFAGRGEFGDGAGPAHTFLLMEKALRNSAGTPRKPRISGVRARRRWSSGANTEHPKRSPLRRKILEFALGRGESSPEVL